MKITEKRSIDVDLSQSVQNEKAVVSVRREDVKVLQGCRSAKVDISPEARPFNGVRELARAGDQMRADKIRRIKEQIEARRYQVDSKSVAKSIVRSEVTRLLEKK